MPIQSALSGLQKYLLVDGQQRLITMLALFAALRDMIRKSNSRRAGYIARTCLINEHEEGSYHYKLLPLPKHRSYFFNSLGSEDNIPAHAFYATTFFRDELEEEPKIDLKVFSEYLLKSFMVVRIELDKDENPYPIFKSLNMSEAPEKPNELDQYHKFAANPRLMALIASGESEQLEFKEGLLARRSDRRLTENRINSVARTVAAFMNSYSGGTLLIGVRDDGSIKGINREYRRIDKGKANWDGYLLHLRNTLRARLKTENPFRFYTITLHKIDNRDVCQIVIKPADSPVYIDKHLYIRSGNQSLEMQGPDLVAYVQNRWK